MAPQAKPKALIAWSSGKDSAWALHDIRKQDSHEIVGALTTVTGSSNRVTVHGVPEEVVRLVHHLADVDPDPHPDQRAGIVEPIADRSLQVLRAPRRAAGGIEREHEPIALVLDDRAPVVRRDVRDHLVVGVHHLHPATVAQDRVRASTNCVVVALVNSALISPVSQ